MSTKIDDKLLAKRIVQHALKEYAPKEGQRYGLGVIQVGANHIT
jgi:hypothetical protein